MRKLLFILVVVLIVSNNVSAQQKPKKGSFGTEIQFNPFDQDGNVPIRRTQIPLFHF